MKINLEPKIKYGRINYGDLIITNTDTYIITDEDSIVSLQTGLLFSGEDFDTLTEMIERDLEELILEVIPGENLIVSRK